MQVSDYSMLKPHDLHCGRFVATSAEVCRRSRGSLTWSWSTTQEFENASRFIAALKQCSKIRDLEGGKKLHQDAITAGLHTNRYVAASLITMYSKCRSLPLARQVFQEVIHRDVVMWNSLILGYVQNQESSAAMDLLASMDCRPNSFTFVAGLKACGGLASENEAQKQFSLQKGIAIHNQVRGQGFDSDIVVSSSLVDMYSKCGSMKLAREVFDRMRSKDVVTWTSLILGYTQNGDSVKAMDLFNNMDCEPDSFAYVAALKACGGSVTDKDSSDKRLCLETGLSIHKQVRDRGWESNLFVANALLDMYSKCRSMDQAREVFDRMVRRDVVSWNTLIVGYVQNGNSSVALDLFTGMDCEASSVTYVAALKACGSLAGEKESERQMYLDIGIKIHEQVRSCGYDTNIFVESSLVDMYSKCGRMTRAREVFDRMVLKDVVSWTSLILGYVQNGESPEAMNLFTSMNCEPNSLTYVALLKACGCLASEKDSDKQTCLEKGIAIHKQIQNRGLNSDMVVASALVDMYSKCGSMDHAKDIFNDMASKDVITWTSLIQGYVQNGQSLLALDLFASMDCESSSFTYVAALKACSNLAALPAGQQIHATVCKLGLEQDRAITTTMIDLYGKCGSMNRAEEVFNNTYSPGIASWNALITGYSSVADPSQVFSLVKKMQEAELQMNGITFICILKACSHAGLVQPAKSFFDCMLSGSSSITPSLEHYSCMIDMLSRANRLHEALALVKSMPFQADAVIWRTLLGACKKWNNLEVAKIAFDSLVAAGTAEAAAYVLMSDIYGRSTETSIEQDSSVINT